MVKRRHGKQNEMSKMWTKRKSEKWIYEWIYERKTKV